MTDIRQIEQLLKAKLQPIVGSANYETWIHGLILSEVTETGITFIVRDEIHLAWIEGSFEEHIQNAAFEVLGRVCQLSFITQREIEGLIVEEETPIAKNKRGLKSDTLKVKKSSLNPSFKFSNFIVGENNQYAHAVARAIVEQPTVVYNPLYIYGDSGLGKTHLMQAIGNAMEEKLGIGSVVYLTSEQFTNEFIEALQTNSINKFRQKYRKAEALLIDDIQFFSGKQQCQNEFFHTFNTLIGAKKHLILTSDTPAGEIQMMNDRLITRFQSGVTVEVAEPCFETRVAILRQKRDDFAVNVDDSILVFLADRITKNVRRLEGALMRIATFASLSNKMPTQDRIEELLRDILKEESRRVVTIDVIQRKTAEHYEIRLADMTSRRRPSNIALARQVAMYLSRRKTKCSLMEIGEAFGGRDHGTVIHAMKTIESKIQNDASFEESIMKLENSLA